MSAPLTTQKITCKVCCFSMTVMTTTSDELLPACERCGAQRWDISTAEQLESLKPISYFKKLLYTKIF